MRKNPSSNISVVLSIVRKFKKECFFLILFLTVDVALETLSVGSVIPMLTITLNNSVVRDNPKKWLSFISSHLSESQQIIVISLGILILFLIRTANNLATKFYSSWFTNHLREYWSTQMFQNLSVNNSALLKNTKGVSLLIDVIVSLLLMISLTVLLLLINWKATLTCVGLLLLFVGFVWNTMMRFSCEFGKNRVKLNEEINQLLCDSSDGWRQIKVLSLERELFSEFRFKLRKLVTGLVKFELINSIPKEVGELSIVFSLVTGLFFAKFYRHVELSLFLPQIVFFSVSFMKLFSAATSVLKKGMEMATCLPSILKVHSLSGASISGEVLSSNPPTIFQRNLAVKNLSFHVAKNHLVLNDLSFQIQKGEFIALIGKVGVGKSTLCDLLAGLYEPSSGAIFLDGVSLKQLDLVQWKKKISYVTQEVFLFNDTIINNILLGNKSARREDAIKAAEIAQAKELVEALPQSFDTVLGPGGITLSGGQKQKIALAQALVREPDFLILDEATNALDYESEEKLFTSLRNNNRKQTILLVTHRTHVLKHVDRTLHLQTSSMREYHSSMEYDCFQRPELQCLPTPRK